MNAGKCANHKISVSCKILGKVQILKTSRVRKDLDFAKYWQSPDIRNHQKFGNLKIAIFLQNPDFKMVKLIHDSMIHDPLVGYCSRMIE